MQLDAFIEGDVYIDYRFEQVKFRWDKKLEKVFTRTKGQPEEECDAAWSLYKDAIRAGKAITREEYFSDPPEVGPR